MNLNSPTVPSILWFTLIWRVITCLASFVSFANLHKNSNKKHSHKLYVKKFNLNFIFVLTIEHLCRCSLIWSIAIFLCQKSLFFFFFSSLYKMIIIRSLIMLNHIRHGATFVDVYYTNLTNKFVSSVSFLHFSLKFYTVFLFLCFFFSCGKFKLELHPCWRSLWPHNDVIVVVIVDDDKDDLAIRYMLYVFYASGCFLLYATYQSLHFRSCCIVLLDLLSATSNH